jgi:hypothetical protein
MERSILFSRRVDKDCAQILGETKVSYSTPIT